MKSNIRLRLFLAGTTLLAAHPAHAATRYWDGTSTTADADGGNGTWNNTNTLWDNANNGGTAVSWNDGDIARFTRGAGTVTVGAAIKAENLQFNDDTTTGYTFSSGVARTITITPAVGGDDGFITQAGAGAVSFDANITIALGKNQAWNAAAPLTVSGIVSGDFNLTKKGAGTLTLNGANTLSGSTTNAAGTLALGNALALQNSTLLTTGSVAGSATAGLTTTATSLTLGGLAGDKNFAATGGVFKDSGGYGAVTALTLNPAAGDTPSYSAAIEDGAVGMTLTKTGAGTQILTGTNAYTGATQVNTGILVIGKTAAKASGAVNVAATGSVGLGVGGDGYYSAVNVGDLFNTNTLAGFSLDSGSGVAIDTTAGNFDQNVALTAGRSLFKLGANTLTLSQENTYTGLTSVTAGTLQLGHPTNTLGGDVTVNGGNLDVDHPDTVGAVTLVAGTISGDSALTGTSYTVQSGTASSELAGSGITLTKTTAGTATLSGPNSYTGVTTISTGILEIAHATALGTTAGNTTIAATGNTTAGGQLRLSGGITSAENITITGNANAFGRVIDNLAGTNTLSGDITLDNNTGGMRLGATAGQLTFAGNISRIGDVYGLTFQANGTSAVSVNNAIANGGGQLNIYSFAGTGTGSVTLKGVSGSGIGATNILQNGTLKLGVADALNPTANLTLGVTTTGNDIATFDLAGFNQTVNALIGTPATTTPAANSNRKVTNSAASGTNTLTVGNGDGTGTFNGVIVDGATAKVALVKTGSGTETLAGVNTYSGDTTVSGGTLALANPNAGNESSTVTIATDAFLNLNFAGTDTVGELVIGSTPMGAGVYGNSGSVSPVIPLSQITGSGTITVSSGGYSAWQAANSTTQTIDQDHDSDGVSNGVEFFIYGPVAATGFTPLPGVTNNDGALSVTWTKAAGYTGTYGAGFVVETSASLADPWVAETLGVTVTITGTEVKYTFPAGTKNFARLKVTGP